MQGTSAAKRARCRLRASCSGLYVAQGLAVSPDAQALPPPDTGPAGRARSEILPADGSDFRKHFRVGWRGVGWTDRGPGRGANVIAHCRCFTSSHAPQAMHTPPKTANPTRYPPVSTDTRAKIGGPTTTPANVTKPAAPVIAPTWPAGALRATCDSCTPFQPIAVPPKSHAHGEHRFRRPTRAERGRRPAAGAGGDADQAEQRARRDVRVGDGAPHDAADDPAEICDGQREARGDERVATASP